MHTLASPSFGIEGEVYWVHSVEQGLAKRHVVHTQVGVGHSTALDVFSRKDKARLGCSRVIEEKPKVEVYWTSV